MIGALRGRVMNRSGGTLLLDVNGVGYELEVTQSIIKKTASASSELELVVFTDVKENSISLFGFSDRVEREMFFLLKKVKGVGSRLALNVVSFMGPEKLLSSIGQSDVSSLQRVPGIGKKTAERLVLELREAVTSLVYEIADDELGQAGTIEKINEGGAATGANPAADAILALEKLGFSSERAKQAISVTLKEEAGRSAIRANDPGSLLKLALTNL